jgi:hypothetical protein
VDHRKPRVGAGSAGVRYLAAARCGGLKKTGGMNCPQCGTLRGISTLICTQPGMHINCSASRVLFCSGSAVVPGEESGSPTSGTCDGRISPRDHTAAIPAVSECRIDPTKPMPNPKGSLRGSPVPGPASPLHTELANWGSATNPS